MEIDLSAPTLANFKVYANGEAFTTFGTAQTSAGLSSYPAGLVKMSGHRNCYIGNHLGETKRLNTAGMADLKPSTGS